MPSNSGDVSHLMYDYISFEAITNTNNLAVSTKVIYTVKEIIAHPNPTTGIFEISSFPDSMHEATIELYTVQMQLISKKTYPVNNGKAQLSLENQANGIYFAKVGLETPVALKIIKK